MKEGMDYFPHDTNSSSDEKIEALRGEFGNDGYAMYFILLERIYKTDTGSLNLNKTVIKKAIVKHIGVSEEVFNNILDFCFEIELFDKSTYENLGVLTSNGIKKRRDEVNKQREKWRKRKVIQKENNSNDEFSNEKIPQSKEKKSKVNKIKENESKTTTTYEQPCCSNSSDIDFNIFTYMQRRGFTSISSIMAEQIQADIEMYSLEEVKQAIDIADNNGKHAYNYVKAILERRRAGIGKDKTREDTEWEKTLKEARERIEKGEDPF